MKIREIRAVGLSGATPEGGWSNELQADDVVHTLLAVHTDEGLVGIGSAFTSESLVKAALEVLTPLCLGANALEPERVTETLRQHTFWLGRGGTITHAISAIDIALWDLFGKATGQPVGRLLGGRHRDRVTPYASVLMDEPEVLADHLRSLAAQGFRAFKIGWGPFGRRGYAVDEAIVKAAREAVGPTATLAVDAGGSDAYWRGDYKWALRTAQMLADYDVAWFEEALPPDALDDFVALRRSSPVPISGGEVLTRRQAFTPFLSAGAFDIVQPDTTKCGGLSESRRIGWLAEEFGARLVPHGWNTAIGLAADLHLASALPATDLVEYKTGSPYVDDILTSNWRLDDLGQLAIPEAPGLGIDLDEERLARYTGGRSLVTP
ncbi:mandelate racemase/muconate lactonizing enzyme family protein [Amycolatopsis taiwanensis]|uniref:mandelate racemase/muconate lactonizing enzyme family protein n=1 Tax=Amycolatopsis taiwanensis TaxID=342230 RepID=UPI0004823E54|nr:mandelate racemase/muconate lactonizing enzyme family protein [Amycolatopsis taiwanensis]